MDCQVLFCHSLYCRHAIFVLFILQMKLVQIYYDVAVHMSGVIAVKQGRQIVQVVQIYYNIAVHMSGVIAINQGRQIARHMFVCFIA